MKEANYATDKFALVHRGVSLLIFVGIIGYAIMDGHIGSPGRTTMFFLVPLTCIWFPDALATANDERVSPKIIRWVGWCLLIMIPLIPLLLSLTQG